MTDGRKGGRKGGRKELKQIQSEAIKRISRSLKQHFTKHKFDFESDKIVNKLCPIADLEFSLNHNLLYR